MWPVIAAIGAQMIGSHMTNQANAQQADKNRDFQQNMSNTSHQREVEDLKAAGLNPLLSGTGGASTPSGGMATMENPLAGAATTALDVQRFKQQLKKEGEEINNLQETNKLIKSQQNKTDIEAEVLKRNLPEAELKNMIWERIKDAAKTGTRIYDKHKAFEDKKIRMEKP